MVDHPRIPVERVVALGRPAAPSSAFSPSVVEAILEVAYLAIAADTRLSDEEVEAFARIAGTLLSPSAPATLDRQTLDAWLDRFAQQKDRDGTTSRLEAAVALLPDVAARATAYRVSCALSLCDLDASDREFEFDLDLIAALGLDQIEADRLAGEVHAAIAGPEE